MSTSHRRYSKHRRNSRAEEHSGQSARALGTRRRHTLEPPIGGFLRDSWDQAGLAAAQADEPAAGVAFAPHAYVRLRPDEQPSLSPYSMLTVLPPPIEGVSPLAAPRMVDAKPLADEAYGQLEPGKAYSLEPEPLSASFMQVFLFLCLSHCSWRRRFAKTLTAVPGRRRSSSTALVWPVWSSEAFQSRCAYETIVSTHPRSSGPRIFLRRESIIISGS